MNHVDAFKYARLAARAADEKLGEEIMAFDVRRESSLADGYLLITGNSHIHIRALEDAVRESLREAGANLKRTDGQRGHLWRVLDYGSLIVHIMDQKTREFYAMEKLWERGKQIEWGEAKKEIPLPPVKKARAPKKATKAAATKKKAAPKKRPKKKR